MMQQMQHLQRLLKDDNVKALLAHPRAREAFRDPDFQQAVQSNDPARIAGHPKLQELMRDPEVAPRLAKVNPRTLFPA